MPHPSGTSSGDRIAGALSGLVAAGSAAYIVMYGVLVCLRITYRFELEWLEGAMVDHVRTILDGRPLYARPDLSFIPLTYTPGYFYLAAAVCRVVGVGLIPLRAISVVSSIGILIVTARLVHHETGSWRAGLLAAGLFAATFGWTSGWLDLARNDSLFLFLAVLSVYVLRRTPTPRGAGAAGVLIALSFLTKQTGLIIAAPLAVWCAMRGWRVFAAFVVPAVGIVAGTTVWFERAFDGWYLYYIYAVPKQHPVSMQSIVGFWRYDVLGPLPVATVFAAGYLAWRVVRGERQAAIFYLLVGAGFFAGAWISRLHSLSYINVVLPAYLIIAIVFAIAIHERVARVPAVSPGTVRGTAVAAYALVLLQLGRVAYSPVSFVPTAEDVAAGEELVRRISEMPGQIFVPFHGYLPSRAGKDTFTHAVMLSDVIRGGTTDVERGLAAQLADALRTHQFDSIVMIEPRTPVHEWLPISSDYEPADLVVTRRSRFWRPERRYVPR